MKILKTFREVDEELSSKSWGKPNFKQDGYVIEYECGCGESHPLNGSDGSIPILQEMITTLSLLMRCNNSFVTHIHQKGLFKPKCISFWSANYDVFLETLNK